MCRNQQRREHHAREQAMRDANARAREFEAQIRAAEERNKAIVEALKPAPEMYTPPPVSSNAMLGGVGIRPKKASTRKTTSGASRRGISQLRIPLNVGQAAAGGTNLPT